MQAAAPAGVRLLAAAIVAWIARVHARTVAALVRVERSKPHARQLCGRRHLPARIVLLRVQVAPVDLCAGRAVAIALYVDVARALAHVGLAAARGTLYVTGRAWRAGELEGGAQPAVRNRPSRTQSSFRALARLALRLGRHLSRRGCRQEHREKARSSP
eukprot:scaffold54585_cov71-Phaeocystis_antarctica.AAC.2